MWTRVHAAGLVGTDTPVLGRDAGAGWGALAALDPHGVLLAKHWGPPPNYHLS